MKKQTKLFSTISLGVGIIVFLAIGARWIWRVRAGQPLDIDEAGYLSFSFLDFYKLTQEGIAGYFSALESSSVQAPLTPALAALIYLVTGPNWIYAFGVPLLSGVGVIGASYSIGRTIASQGVAAVSALLVGSCPIIINYSRSFHFAMPVTFITTMALLALLKSDRCRHLGWASLFGLGLGLMPLTRTMTVAFLPGLAIGAFVYVAADGEKRGRRLIMLGWSFFFAAIVMGAWLFPNRNEVFGYLLNYGYGNHAVEYGPSNSPLGLEAWLTEARIFIFSLYLSHAFVIIFGFLALAYLLVRHLLFAKPTKATSPMLASKVTPLLIFIVEAVVSLTSTQNKGSAFIAPVIPAAIIVSVYAFDRLWRHRYYQRVGVVLTIIVVMLGGIPSIDLSLSHLWIVDLPVLGPSTLTDGVGTIQLYEIGGGFQNGNRNEPIDPSEGKAWLESARVTAIKLKHFGSERLVTAFGFLHVLYNTNTVGLAQWVYHGGWTAFVAVDPVDTRDTVDADVTWLTRGRASAACMLLTLNGENGQFRPIANQVTMTLAAKQVGFETIDTWTLPDGQMVTLWRRNSQQLHCNDTIGD